ncbi:MAG: hypothetical protein QY320_08340 [Gammaproteobacteria bacterium]|nr:MAG: hypothetical protein QY320_08340 [Gammaproteobacteria bacterium]
MKSIAGLYGILRDYADRQARQRTLELRSCLPATDGPEMATGFA